MQVTDIAALVVATTDLIGDVTRSIAKAMVALFVGVALDTVAGVLYVVFRPVETEAHAYFSAASQVGVGVLVALVVELRATKGFLEASLCGVLVGGYDPGPTAQVGHMRTPASERRGQSRAEA